MDWSDFEEDAKQRTYANRAGCGVCRLVASLDMEDAKKVTAVLENPSVSHRAIYDAMKARGVAIGRDAIAAHRNGRCSG